MKRTTRYLSLFLAVCILFIPISVFSEDQSAPKVAAIVITTLEVDSAGHATVIGYIPTANATTQVTCLVMDSETLQTADQIAWIDQMTVGYNGTFLTQFYIPDRFSGKTLYFRFGSDADTETITEKYELGTILPGIENITNGSVIYGVDAYMCDSGYLTPENVANSIVYGGNKIYFKIGNRWYDLLNTEATSNEYLKAENAMSDTEVQKISIRYYYTSAKRIEY